jgi:AcrR family transcriptional regulator
MGCSIILYGVPDIDKVETVRSPRRSESEFRDHVLETGATMVEAMQGVRISLDADLDFEKVISNAGVSRSTAYRYWNTKEAFYDDLLCYLAGPGWRAAAVFDAEMLGAISQVVVDNLALLDSEDGRKAVLREAVRKGAKHSAEGIARRVQWRTYVALTATLLSLPQDAHDRRERLLASLRETETKYITDLATFFESMALVLGFKLRYNEGFDTLAAAGAAIIEGLALRAIVMPKLVHRAVNAPGLDGQDVKWGLSALAFWGVVEALTELDDAYNPTTALAEYFRRSSAGSTS